jgi:hypothetical protein
LRQKWQYDSTSILAYSSLVVPNNWAQQPGSHRDDDCGLNLQGLVRMLISSEDKEADAYPLCLPFETYRKLLRAGVGEGLPHGTRTWHSSGCEKFAFPDFEAG